MKKKIHLLYLDENTIVGAKNLDLLYIDATFKLVKHSKQNQQTIIIAYKCYFYDLKDRLCCLGIPLYLAIMYDKKKNSYISVFKMIKEHFCKIQKIDDFQIPFTMSDFEKPLINCKIIYYF